MLAGNSLPEVKELPEGQSLLIRQLLKYQCQESLPQFKPCRLIRVKDVWENNDKDYLKALLDNLLIRENRDSRILFSVFELILSKNELDIHELLDNFDLEPIRKQKEFKASLFERDSLEPGHFFTGPAIISQNDATTIVLPDFDVKVDQFKNLIMNKRKTLNGD